MNDFWSALFDPGELTCYWDQSYLDIRPSPAGASTEREEFTINPIRLGGQRKDADIAIFRNILVEIDSGTEADQAKFIHEKGLPITTAVWSGNKSLHFLISLTEPCQNAEEYRALAKSIYIALGSLIDNANANPSRGSRVPGSIRVKTGQAQELRFVGSRIKREDLDFWIWKNTPGDISLTKPKSIIRGPTSHLPLFQATRDFLQNGPSPGERHKQIFLSTCDLTRHMYDLDQILEAISGCMKIDEESRRVICDAHHRALADMKAEEA